MPNCLLRPQTIFASLGSGRFEISDVGINGVSSVGESIDKYIEYLDFYFSVDTNGNGKLPLTMRSENSDYANIAKLQDY